MRIIARRLGIALARLDDSLWGDAIGAIAIFVLLIMALFLTYGVFG